MSPSSPRVWLNGSTSRAPDGFETTLEVNVLSQALLALLLLPKMRATATAASDASFAPHLSFLHKHRRFLSHYLANLALLDVIEGLIERRGQDDAGRKIIINASCPWGCKTNMGRNFPGFVKPILVVQHFFCERSAEQGARSLVEATALGSESQGKLWSNDNLDP